MEETMTKLYESTVVELGVEAEIFFAEKMIVIFNDTVPQEFKDIAIIHKPATFHGDVQEGDLLVLGNESFKVTFVGGKANETLKDLGHCTISFNGENFAELPGTICVEDKEIPEINVGTEISFLRA